MRPKTPHPHPRPHLRPRHRPHPHSYPHLGADCGGTGSENEQSGMGLVGPPPKFTPEILPGIL